MSFVPTGPSNVTADAADDLDAGFTSADGGAAPSGVGPWKLAWRRLRRNKVAMFFGFVFVLLVVICLLAPVYSSDIAHRSPTVGNVTGTITIGGHKKNIVGFTGIPIGPTWHFKSFFFGADGNGRDTAVRLLYGGRNSLEVGAIATVITVLLAVVLGIVAGYFRGFADSAISRVMDIIWAFPALLLAISLGTIFAVGGLGPIHGGNLFVPGFIIGLVYIPYMARPVRGQVLQLRERDFVDAARQQGLSSVRIMASEILPNLGSTIVVFVPLILANAILLEAGLSYVGVGVLPPNPSWGNMISDGIMQIPAAFSNVLVPGIMLVLTVMSVNIFGDGLRDALDPRAKVKASAKA